MYINFEQEEIQKYRGESYCSIGIYSNGKSFSVRLRGPDIPMIKGVEGRYPLKSYHDSLKKVMINLFEAQVLRD
jgi:hypothetical protein